MQVPLLLCERSEWKSHTSTTDNKNRIWREQTPWKVNEEFEYWHKATLNELSCWSNETQIHYQISSVHTQFLENISEMPYSNLKFIVILLAHRDSRNETVFFFSRTHTACNICHFWCTSSIRFKAQRKKEEKAAAIRCWYFSHKKQLFISFHFDRDPHFG